ncbi:uncharacterized protein G2W53_015701 [Senna tora]|uniref:Uncharacterized protein n=1 Tax=Senna tora TaxID=362788 RepID=A0A834WWU3_9FABA|nr:uncharacterized protein G2W53_015701 [Senna tora]
MGLLNSLASERNGTLRNGEERKTLIWGFMVVIRVYGSEAGGRSGMRTSRKKRVYAEKIFEGI